MKNNKSDRCKNWYANNPFFENKLGYDGFTEAMMMVADNGDFPITLEVKEPESLSAKDIQLFSQHFKQDTGLNIEFHLLTCNHCDKLHCIMIVDELPEWKMESECS